MQRTAQGVVADLSAATSGGAVSIAWLAPVTDMLQLIATVVAIVTGVYAIRWHRVRIKLAKEKADAKSERDSS